MAKFKVLASCVNYYSVEIDAVDSEEAYEIARDMDGGEFLSDGYGDWDIDQIYEVKDEN
jgi:hypothetical protein